MLREVVGRLEEMPPEQKERWRELMSYLDAFVYHTRSGPEVAPLLQVIATSLRSEDNRREVEAMQKTMAQVLQEKGKLEGKRETLLRQLRKRFGDVPAEMLTTIETTNELPQFEEWLDAVLDAKTLEEVGIAPTSE